MKDFIRLAGTLCIITFLAAATLGGINAMTKDRIAENKIKAQNEAMNKILSQAESFNELEDGIFEGVSGGSTVGYCVTADPSGYGGELSLMIGVDQNGVMTGLEVLSHSETAGLGANCTKGSFKAQFPGKEYPVTVFKGATSKTNEISAITGATITSRAVADGVNQAYEKLEKAGLLTEGGAK